MTPNPTPSRTEPPSSSAGYSQPAQGAGWSNVGGVQAYSGGLPKRWVPNYRKTLWLAIPLAWFFGPIGLLYAIGDSKPQLIAWVAYVVAAIAVHNPNFVPTLPIAHPIMLTCVVWSIFAVLAINRRHKV